MKIFKRHIYKGYFNDTEIFFRLPKCLTFIGSLKGLFYIKTSKHFEELLYMRDLKSLLVTVDLKGLLFVADLTRNLYLEFLRSISYMIHLKGQIFFEAPIIWRNDFQGSAGQAFI